MNKIYSLIVLVALVLGCVEAANPISASSGGKDAGIVIQDFFFKVQSIMDDEKAAATFSVANIGSKTITGDIYVWFYGPFLGKNAWTIEPEGSVDISSGEAIIRGETFFPPVPEKSIPGSVKKFDILLTPPDLPAGTKQDYTFYTEICYPYSTAAFAEIISVSQNEFSVQQKTDMSAVQTQNTKGPLQLSLVSRKNIRTSKNIPLVFNVNDIAGGYSTASDETCTLNIDAATRGKASITVLVDGSPNSIDCGSGDNTATVDIINKKGIVFCSYELPQNSMPRSTMTVTAFADYKYYSRKSSSITVEDAFSQN